MLNLGPWFERRDVHRSVLVDLHDAVAVGPHHPEEPVGAVLFCEHSLLDLWLKAGGVGEDPDLDEPHRLVLRGVLLRVERAGAKRHALHGAGGQRPVLAADVVLVSKASFNDVSQPFDVLMGMERPDRARDQAIVVEDAHRTEAVVLGIPVLVEREMPACAEPAALGVVDFFVPSDLDHSSYPSWRAGRCATETIRRGLWSLSFVSVRWRSPQLYLTR